MKRKKRKGLKTCFKKGLLPHNKGIKRESTDLNSSNEFHYIRSTANEAMMAKEDPLRSYCTSNHEDMDGGAYSTMVLRRKPDAPLEVERKNSGFVHKYVTLHFHFSFKVYRGNNSLCSV